jgi:DeoR/GlpR family transcriptional regulator of sugar metabolism
VQDQNEFRAIQAGIGNMLREERHYYILEQLRREGKVQTQELSRTLQVSEDTLRRDLRDLAANGKLQRVHGGALPRSSLSGSFAERQEQAVAAKQSLAVVAARLLQDNQVILIDGGTTNLQVVHNLPRTLQATIITSSPAIALALLPFPQVEVLLLGGRLAREAVTTVGIATAEALHGVRADVCLLGVCSLHEEIGLTVADSEEALVKRLMIAQSGEVIAVVVADKLGTALPYVVAPVSELTHLVVEHFVPDEVIAPYIKLGISVLRG